MEITAGIFLMNSKGEILICHPTGANHKTWSIPKGLVEPLDRNEFETAKRELYEETNIDLDDLKILKSYRLELQYYNKQKKTLIPFFVLVDDRNYVFDLKCNSFIKNSKKPEIDKYFWSSIGDCFVFLHPTQKSCCNEIIDILKT
jgi:8-oxo-dGTP pyrophosphatase MutT (NUDIX family)